MSEDIRTKGKPVHVIDDDGVRTTIFPNGQRVVATAETRMEARVRQMGKEAMTPEVVKGIMSQHEWDDIEDPEQQLFLNALACCGVVAQAARIAGIDRNVLYSKWQHEDAFKKAYAFASKKPGADLILEEMWRRGMDGVPEPVFYQGALVGTVQRYSDTILVALAKASMPELFGTKVHVAAEIHDKRESAPEIPSDEDRQRAVVDLYKTLGERRELTPDGPTAEDEIQ